MKSASGGELGTTSKYKPLPSVSFRAWRRGSTLRHIGTIGQLEEVYNTPVPPAAAAADVDHIIPPYARFIEASPFFVLATSGPAGLDCSARGDPPGFVRVQDQRTIVFPDRRGNNKIDSLRCQPASKIDQQPACNIDQGMGGLFSDFPFTG